MNVGRLFVECFFCRRVIPAAEARHPDYGDGDSGAEWVCKDAVACDKASGADR